MGVMGQSFIDHSRSYLTADHLPRIVRSVEEVSDEDLWWRPNPVSNSMANLLSHLAGNVRQWVVSGVGGEPDVRQREQEFDTASRPERRHLVEGLESAVWSADAVLARLDPGRLRERRLIQGREVTVLEAIYHAVEHFSMHAGQIIYIAKLRTARDLGFFEVEGGLPRRRW